MKTLFLECNMGAAGDMLMGALYEICDQKELFLATMNDVFAPFQVSVEAEAAEKCGIGGTRMRVRVHGEEEAAPPQAAHTVRSLTLHDSIKNASPKSRIQTDDAWAGLPDEPDGHMPQELPDGYTSGEYGGIPDGYGTGATGMQNDRQTQAMQDMDEYDGRTDGGHAHSHDGAIHTHEGPDSTHAHGDGHAHGGHAHGNHVHSKHGAHVHTDYPSVCSRISSLPLPDPVKEAASAVYTILGESEAKVHGTTLEQIHFHEVGTLDALADIVGCALLIHLIAPEQILASPIHLGSGFVRCAHGVLPVPAPATAEILNGIPCYTGAIAGELCTPTGAALLKYYVSRFFSMPPMITQAVGYGMGKKDFEIANCVRVFLGETFVSETPDWQDPAALTAFAEAARDAVLAAQAGAAADAVDNDAEALSPAPGNTAENTPAKATGDTAGKHAGEAEDLSPASGNDTAEDDYGEGFPSDDSVLAISCNIDDMTGEALGLAAEILMAAGALDVYTIPIQMKKSRPGILLTCICEPGERDKFTALFFLHTSTRGIRYQIYERSTLESTFVTRSTAYGNIRIKKSSGYGIEKEKPEFEDLKSVVLKNGCSLSLDDVTKSLR